MRDAEFSCGLPEPKRLHLPSELSPSSIARKWGAFVLHFTVVLACVAGLLNVDSGAKRAIVAAASEGNSAEISAPKSPTTLAELTVRQSNKSQPIHAQYAVEDGDESEDELESTYASSLVSTLRVVLPTTPAIVFGLKRGLLNPCAHVFSPRQARAPPQLV